MNIFKDKTSRALILIMCALVLLGILVSVIYYKSLNKSIDPRIVKARTLYEKYNVYALNNDFDSIFLLMDSIESIYTSVEHYHNSFETGVLYNNRAAAFLTMAIFSENSKKSMEVRDSLINLAELKTLYSIEIYNNWLAKFENKNKEEIESLILNDFYKGLDGYPDNKKVSYLKKRIKEIQEAQIETARRLSVSYTNLGIIYRHKQLYEEAAQSYKKAIELWDRNLTAENNLNLLLGRPLTKRSFIQKMFPPKRK
jgi:tetratricopeptide (TPR) repeat protein